MVFFGFLWFSFVFFGFSSGAERILTHSFVCDVYPMQLVAPRAVSIAVAIDAMICTIHFKVSFFVIFTSFL